MASTCSVARLLCARTLSTTFWKKSGAARPSRLSARAIFDDLGNEPGHVEGGRGNLRGFAGGDEEKLPRPSGFQRGTVPTFDRCTGTLDGYSILADATDHEPALGPAGHHRHGKAPQPLEIGGCGAGADAFDALCQTHQIGCRDGVCMAEVMA
jgi:hypothetical protein